MISLHTSPLDQPGTGDAGGMNVYVVELAKRLAARGIAVDIFTRATSSRLAPVVPAFDGVTVHHVHAGPFEGLTKGELPGQLCVFAREVLRAEAAQPEGHYDVVHSHYWLSGQVGALARDRWGVPLVHTMHTMAKVKNDALAVGDTPEPRGPDHRRGAGRRGRRRAGRQHRPRGQAADQPVRRRPDAGARGPPGRRPRRLPAAARSPRRAARSACPRTPWSCSSPAGSSRSRRPTCCCAPSRCCSSGVPTCARASSYRWSGGPSGSGLEHPESLAQLAAELGLDDVVRFVPPVEQAELARWCAAASVVAVPSYNESFGLVAVEAQATGTPVVAAAVGGLTTVVRDGHSGLLRRHPRAGRLGARARAPAGRRSPARRACRAARSSRPASFAWETTAEHTLDVYEQARRELLRAVS